MEKKFFENEFLLYFHRGEIIEINNRLVQRSPRHRLLMVKRCSRSITTENEQVGKIIRSIFAAKEYRGKERKGKNISTHPSWKDTIQGSGEGMEETLRTGTQFRARNKGWLQPAWGKLPVVYRPAISARIEIVVIFL